MKRMMVVLWICGGIPLLSGCPEAEPDVLWLQAVLLPDDSCQVSPLLGSSIQTVQKGTVDLAVNREGYIAAVQAVNNMARSEEVTGFGPTSKHLETNNMQLIGATVNYDTAGLDVDLPQGFFQYTPTGILPQEAAVGIVNLLPPAVMAELRKEPWLVGTKAFEDPLLSACYQTVDGAPPTWKGAPLGGREVEIVARVRFEAALLDGTEVISNELRFPIRVCNGCLVTPQGHPGRILDLFSPTSFDEPLICNVPQCIPGADRCFDVRKCFVDNFYVEEGQVERLQQCANDPNFPPPSIPLCNPPLQKNIGCYDPTEDVQTKIQHLFFRFAFERVDAFCALEHEAPLWEPQP